MFALFKFLLIIFLAVILFILIFAAFFALRFWGMIKSIVNGNKHTDNKGKVNGFEGTQQSYGSQSASTSSTTSNGKKIFAPEDGEYVEFEEVP